MNPIRPATAFPDLLSDVEQYYSDRLTEYGATPRGVDWNGAESQTTRFVQLEKIIEPRARLSVNDIGCGYGAMFEFLRKRHRDVDYLGCDISPSMVNAARAQFDGSSNATFAVESEPRRIADYGIASGIFNVRLSHTDEQWLSYMLATLDAIARTSRLGFAFNCLTSYSDPDKKRDYLYYADPRIMFDHCMTRYSRHVSLLHDYGLYEFTMLVRKET